MSLKDELVSAANTAQGAAQNINNAALLTEEICFKNIRKYVYAKYLLADDVQSDGTLDDLARISLSRMLGIVKEDVDKKDLPSCYGVTAITDKKILLLMRLEKDLDIFLFNTESANIRTLRDLSAAVYRAKNAGGSK